MCYKLMRPFQDLFDLGYIKLIGGSLSLEEFIESKLAQYSHNPFQRSAYQMVAKGKIPSYKTKFSSTTQFLINDWRDLLEKGSIIPLFETPRYSPPANLESRCAGVLHGLDGNAFIIDNITPIVFGSKSNLHETATLHRIINRSYFHSYTRELQAGLVSQLIRLATPYDIPYYAPCVPYRQLLQTINSDKSFLSQIRTANSIDLLGIKNSDKWLNVLTTFSTRESFMKESTNVTKQIAVIVALDEEFRQFMDIANESAKFIGNIPSDQYYAFEIDGPGLPQNLLRFTVRLIGEMGPDAASSVASAVLNELKGLDCIVSLGIAASLNSDIGLCNVVIGTQIDSYAANLKAVSEKKVGFDLKHRGAVYALPQAISDGFKNFEFKDPIRFRAWQEACKLDYVAPDDGGLVSAYRVHLASGPIVGATSAFGAWLRTRDDTLYSLEMEAASIAAVANKRRTPVPVLAIKGISDFANEGKQELDQSSKNSFRKIAMRNATRYMFSALSSINIFDK
ncbi:MAG: hypothetical protein IPJ27_07150 [Candidatus Accumulibacter sp.]|uniref:Nucleoside phosphorylase domain-containing protein n=1 Tax=Candidatus Accumulibacter proximus TaxID=2954385 RepID=A0A935UFE7_9PROT|nr:hypothetical protein [Candidatus Accumulibacter proximus]